MTGHIFRTFHSTYDSRIVIFYHFTYVSKYLQFLFFHSSVCKQLLYYMYSIPYLNEPYSIRQGSPASGSWTSTGQWHFRSQATRKVNGRWMSKASSNTYHISPLLAFPSMEKLSSAKLVPGAKKVGDHCYMEKTSTSHHQPGPLTPCILGAVSMLAKSHPVWCRGLKAGKTGLNAWGQPSFSSGTSWAGEGRGQGGIKGLAAEGGARC